VTCTTGRAGQGAIELSIADNFAFNVEGQGWMILLHENQPIHWGLGRLLRQLPRRQVQGLRWDKIFYLLLVLRLWTDVAGLIQAHEPW
jgi:hypothetical protein